MKIRLILILVLFTTIIHGVKSQHIIAGQIFDSKTKKPIPFCEVAYNMKNGTLSDEKGHFELKIPVRARMNDSIYFLNISYHSLAFSLQELKSASIEIMLSPRKYQIPEVAISGKKSKTKKFGIYRRKLMTPYLGKKGRKVALYIPNKRKRKGIIKNLQYYLVKSGMNPKHPFRAHIFAVDPITKGPGKELLPENVFGAAKEGNEWVVVNVQKFRVEYPPEGFFIGFEFLSDNHGDRATSSNSHTHFNAVLGFSMEKFRQDLVWRFNLKDYKWFHDANHVYNGRDSYTDSAMMAAEVIMK